MKKVSSLSDFSALCKAHSGAISNCYLLREEVETLVAEGTLLFSQSGAGVVFFENCDDFYRVRYLAAEDISALFHADKPLVCELSGTSSRGIPGLETHAETLEKGGFSPAGGAARLNRTLEDFAVPADFTKICEVRPAAEAQIPAISTLWRAAFDALTVALPSKKKLANLVAEGRVLVAVSPSGEVCGAAFTTPRGATGELSHIAVDSGFRGGGVGSALELAALSALKAAGAKTVRLWVLDGATAALNFHKKFGFSPDGRISRLYIKK